MKREPLLVDQFLATSGMPDFVIPRKMQQVIRDRLIEAKRFVLDATATRYVGDFIDKVPEAVAYAQEFAIPPFPLMYVEFPAPELWKAVTHAEPNWATNDRTLGYLYAGPRVYVLAGGGRVDAAGVPPESTNDDQGRTGRLPSRRIFSCATRRVLLGRVIQESTGRRYPIFPRQSWRANPDR
jgi:hypothetical protein